MECKHLRVSQILYKESFMSLKADILKLEAVHN
jgi:hypothetical protein